MGYMAGVTDDPYQSRSGDAGIDVYDKFVYGYGTSARMLNMYVQFGESEEGQPIVSMDQGRSYFLRSDVHGKMEVDFAIVAMAVYFHGADTVGSNSYAGIVERAAALVSLKLEDFIEYGHRYVNLEEHPQLLTDVIEYLMSVK